MLDLASYLTFHSMFLLGLHLFRYLLQIYGIKTLVKSYLPFNDAHVRLDIESLLDILRKMLSYGEISKDLQSRYISFRVTFFIVGSNTMYSFMLACSPVDKAHLRLASAKAVIRLSRVWDQKIPVDIFYLTLRVSEVGFYFLFFYFLSIYNFSPHYYQDRRLLVICKSS